MRIFFALLSFFYVAAIFTLAGSPIVHTLSEFNPYSLLHIPLFGILAFLLICSLVPITQAIKKVSIQRGGDSRGLPSKETRSLKVRLFFAGGIALVVGIFDEIHQLYVPGRDGSASDVFLDAIGIVLVLLLCFWLFKTRLSRQTR